MMRLESIHFGVDHNDEKTLKNYSTYYIKLYINPNEIVFTVNSP